MRHEELVKPDLVYSVSQITELVKSTLETAFPLVWVEGEVSNYKKHTAGHVYFTLKDEKCSMKTVLFRSDARKVGFEMKDGIMVTCRGRISVYDVRGEYQLYADLIEPMGKGALQMAFEKLKEKLKAEGLFDPEHKKTLPLRPRKIGVVKSMGIAKREVLGLFLFEGIILGLIGSLVGLALGMVFNIYFAVFGFDFSAMLGSFNYPMDLRIFFEISPGSLIQILLIGVIVSSVVSVLPSWRASRMNAVDAIKSV